MKLFLKEIQKFLYPSEIIGCFKFDAVVKISCRPNGRKTKTVHWLLKDIIIYLFQPTEMASENTIIK